ncbi:hypothetical protein [Deinococcus maricopensis]|uniref:Uncharacterized protein n=1 Tax=Deinococcus maricopensis (strain DSM 21211 / LMG 22137 / NRRL B-23946 / LB-34) TaxID=709986 RepID=E8U8P3_DEIML|nr:hypothetical protein [Deinococcus maricopensis]ADV67432.1 hypothetical protein Deima_1784 [Deinococcus maricopensis DSM 21211]
MSSDPYREWLRATISVELGVHDADRLIQSAIIRREWPLGRALGPREAVAVLQDAYVLLMDRVGDARAERWLQGATVALANLAERVPAPSVTEVTPPPLTAALTPDPRPGIRPLTPPPAWGRRASDLALILARAQQDVAQQGLDVIRATPDLAPLEPVMAWNVQAAAAEVARVETEDRYGKLRADHVRQEVADEVALAQAQRDVLNVMVQRLRGAVARGEDASAQLRHHELMLEQSRAFLTYFEALPDVRHDPPLPDLGTPDLNDARVALAVPLHPLVLRARHAYNHALWLTGSAESEPASAARAHLHAAETQARTQLEGQLHAARAHLVSYRDLMTRLHAVEAHIDALERALQPDDLDLAQLRAEARQHRNAARAQMHRYHEAIHVLNALTSAQSAPSQSFPPMTPPGA